VIGSMELMALVDEAEHTEVAYAARHTEVEEGAAAVAVAAVAVAAVAVVAVVAVGWAAIGEVVGLVVACYDAAPVPAEIEYPLHDSSHSIPALLP
jgi:hypothetical protein